MITKKQAIFIFIFIMTLLCSFSYFLMKPRYYQSTGIISLPETNKGLLLTQQDAHSLISSNIITKELINQYNVKLFSVDTISEQVYPRKFMLTNNIKITYKAENKQEAVNFILNVIKNFHKYSEKELEQEKEQIRLQHNEKLLLLETEIIQKELLVKILQEEINEFKPKEETAQHLLLLNMYTTQNNIVTNLKKEKQNNVIQRDSKLNEFKNIEIIHYPQIPLKHNRNYFIYFIACLILSSITAFGVTNKELIINYIKKEFI